MVGSLLVTTTGRSLLLTMESNDRTLHTRRRRSRVVDWSDDLFVIARPGDEVSLSFDATRLPTLRTGWTRTFLLYSDGYSKEMDINSASPDQVSPLPFHGMSKYPYSAPEAYPLTPERQRYMERYNTRVVNSSVYSIDCELALRAAEKK